MTLPCKGACHPGFCLGKQDSSPRTWSGQYTEWNLGPHCKVLQELGEKEIAVSVENGMQKTGQKVSWGSRPFAFHLAQLPILCCGF